jgi:ATP-dependent DNA helicase RecQ
VIYSIGYQGFRSAEDFVEVLKAHKVDLLVDVRSRPVARFNPTFSQGPLSSRLPLAGIAYQWAGEHLGGFGKIEDRALRELADMSAGRVVCTMCMEADPDRCHRKTAIAARLVALGVEVRHLNKPGEPIAEQTRIDKIHANTIRHAAC